jgi:flagellar basal-body rod protein FlgG
MFNGMRIGSSGMKTAQNVMDNVADQISNASTAGYKQKQADFSDLLVNEIGKNQLGISAGSKAVMSKTDFRQGAITPSEGSFHMALEGRGFFGVVSPEGELTLTRNGGFHQNGDNSITDDSGNLLSMECYVPFGQWPQGSEISIGGDGLITAKDSSSDEVQLGKVIIYAPGNSDELTSLGEGRYSLKDGLALYNSADNPGIGFGVLRQRALESSNVDTIQSMTDMIMTQRAYQVNAKSITAADDMLEVINTIT